MLYPISYWTKTVALTSHFGYHFQNKKGIDLQVTWKIWFSNSIINSFVSTDKTFWKTVLIKLLSPKSLKSCNILLCFNQAYTTFSCSY